MINNLILVYNGRKGTENFSTMYERELALDFTDFFSWSSTKEYLEFRTRDNLGDCSEPQGLGVVLNHVSLVDPMVPLRVFFMCHPVLPFELVWR